MTSMRMGLAFVVSGPSGVGKTALLEVLFESDSNLRFSVSMTTRPPRDGEQDGVDYYFVDDPGFAAAVAAGELLEHATVHRKSYGTPREPVEALCAAGHDVVLDIDVQGARQVRAASFPATFILIAPPSLEVLRQRLVGRGTETAESLEIRTAAARQELAARDLFDYEVINDRLAVAADQLAAIITAERCRIRT